MKAIYINLDPYLQAVADWVNAGKPGTAPHFDPLPVAVTIPLGEDACIYCVGNTDGEGAQFLVSGEYLFAAQTGTLDPSGAGPFIATNVSPGFSMFPSWDSVGQKYAVAAVSADSLTVPINIMDAEANVLASVSILVLVRREQASGPVDLVDFTPPAAAPSAADIKSALIAAGNTALAGVTLGGAILLANDTDPEDNTIVKNDDGERGIEYLDPSDAVMVVGSQSNS